MTIKDIGPLIVNKMLSIRLKLALDLNFLENNTLLDHFYCSSLLKWRKWFCKTQLNAVVASNSKFFGPQNLPISSNLVVNAEHTFMLLSEEMYLSQKTRNMPKYFTCMA